jgi:DNA-binding PadR family transcriptional regulator
MPNTQLTQLSDALAETKFRMVSQGDLLIMKCLELDDSDHSASSIILKLTMAQGKMMALSQISPILKTLMKHSLISAKEVSSEVTGRPMSIYSLTKRGESVLELGEELVKLVARGSK